MKHTFELEHLDRTCLVGADSVLSLIFHRYRSMLPEDVQRDVEASYVDCRRQAERIKPRADELCREGS